jgi:hypothetical protein
MSVCKVWSYQHACERCGNLKWTDCARTVFGVSTQPHLYELSCGTCPVDDNAASTASNVTGHAHHCLARFPLKLTAERHLPDLVNSTS